MATAAGKPRLLPQRRSTRDRMRNVGETAAMTTNGAAAIRMSALASASTPNLAVSTHAHVLQYSKSVERINMTDVGGRVGPINRMGKVDLTDPWGEAWAVDSPYDASLAYSANPARMASRQSAYFYPDREIPSPSSLVGSALPSPSSHILQTPSANTSSPALSGASSITASSTISFQAQQPWSEASSATSAGSSEIAFAQLKGDDPTSAEGTSLMPLRANGVPLQSALSQNTGNSKRRSVSFHGNLAALAEHYGPSGSSSSRSLYDRPRSEYAGSPSFSRARSSSHLSSQSRQRGIESSLMLPRPSSSNRGGDFDIMARRQSIASLVANELPPVPIDPRVLAKQQKRSGGAGKSPLSTTMTASNSLLGPAKNAGDNASIMSSSRFSQISVASTTRRKSTFAWLGRAPSQNDIQGGAIAKPALSTDSKPLPTRAYTTPAPTQVTHSPSKSTPPSPSKSNARSARLTTAPPVPPMPQSSTLLQPSSQTQQQRVSPSRTASALSQASMGTPSLLSVQTSSTGATSLPSTSSYNSMAAVDSKLVEQSRQAYGITRSPPSALPPSQTDTTSREFLDHSANSPANVHNASSPAPAPALVGESAPQLPTLKSLMDLSAVRAAEATSSPGPDVTRTPQPKTSLNSLSNKRQSAVPPRSSSLKSLSSIADDHARPASSVDTGPRPYIPPNSHKLSSFPSSFASKNTQTAFEQAEIVQSHPPPRRSTNGATLPQVVEEKLQMSKQAMRPVVVEQCRYYPSSAGEDLQRNGMVSSASVNSLQAIDVPLPASPEPIRPDSVNSITSAMLNVRTSSLATARRDDKLGDQATSTYNDAASRNSNSGSLHSASTVRPPQMLQVETRSVEHEQRKFSVTADLKQSDIVVHVVSPSACIISQLATVKSWFGDSVCST